MRSFDKDAFGERRYDRAHRICDMAGTAVGGCRCSPTVTVRA
jgi:hypothetical protein